jgi:hypothetical protein
MALEFSVVIDLPFVVALVGGVLAVIDAIARLRRGSAVLAILQIIAAVLFVLSLFVANVPFGAPLLALVTVILLLLQLVFSGGTRRGGAAITVIAVILLVIWLVLIGGRVVIPGVNA